MFDKSFITLHRKIIKSAVFEDAELLKVWIWCLVRANHKDCDVIHAGQVVPLKRGQFITGRFTASEELKMSSDKYRKRIVVLEKLNQIAKKTTNKYTIITVVNYSYYQDKPEKNPNKTPTKPQQNPTDNNVNNEEQVPCETSSQELSDNQKDMAWNKQPDDFEEAVVDLDGDGIASAPKKPQTKKYPHAPVVLKLFQEILGQNESFWRKSPAILEACERLYTERGEDKIRNALEYYKENREDKYCPQVTSPKKLEEKYSDLSRYKIKKENE